MTLVADLPAAAPAPTLRLRPIPVAEPRPAVGVLSRGDATTPGQEPLPLGPGGGPPPAWSGWSGWSGWPGRRHGGAAGPAGPAGPSGAARPEPREWALQFSQVALEVATGLRPPAQLLRWTTPRVLAALTRRHALAQRSGGRPPRGTVRSVHVCEPAGGVAEVAAVVAAGARVRALAFRMEGEGDRWRVSALELG
jgi:hypothetical protein